MNVDEAMAYAKQAAKPKKRKRTKNERALICLLAELEKVRAELASANWWINYGSVETGVDSAWRRHVARSRG